MSRKLIRDMKDFHTYPMVTKHGIKELLYYKGYYFDDKIVDVSDDVDYYILYTNISRNERCI